MHRTNQLMKLSAGALCVMLALLNSGCALVPAKAEPIAVATRPPAPPVQKQAPVATPPRRVAIVLSDGKPAYQNVAIELARLLQEPSVYTLGEDGLSPEVAMNTIAEAQTDVVVAIGLRAAIAAAANSKSPVVFCQVFNFSGYDLISDRFKGVASLPPLHLQVEAWKRLDPDLNNVGAILGEGHEYLIAEAVAATEQHGVKLHYRTAKSDRETLYLFNQLLPHIDGFWLFPDNRVLSPSVLRQMFDYASRHDIQIAVFNESLLGLGATMSATAIASDIAARIIEVVDQFYHGSGESIPDITPLTTLDILTNEAVLLELGLKTAGIQTSAGIEDVR